MTGILDEDLVSTLNRRQILVRLGLGFAVTYAMPNSLIISKALASGGGGSGGGDGGDGRHSDGVTEDCSASADALEFMFCNVFEAI